MHNIKTNFDIIFDICKSIFCDQLVADDNFYEYPNKPKMTDLQLVALALTAEALGIDSENHLFKKLNEEYKSEFASLIDRSNYNRRRKKLSDFISQIGSSVSKTISPNMEAYIIDSMPLAICKNARIPRCNICKDDHDCLPAIGYHAVSKAYYYGFKFHLIISKAGVPVTAGITPANIADIDFLKDETVIEISDCELLGDKGYISGSVQLSLFENYSVKLLTPKRANMKGESMWKKSHSFHRKKIETRFSQLDDQFMAKRNYAKTSDGLITRLVSKIAAVAVLQLINFEKGRPINKLKSALAA